MKAHNKWLAQPAIVYRRNGRLNAMAVMASAGVMAGIIYQAYELSSVISSVIISQYRPITAYGLNGSNAIPAGWRILSEASSANAALWRSCAVA